MARRFETLVPGAILILRANWHTEREEGQRVANENPIRTTEEYIGLAMVTDRWFDPVEGQRRKSSGEMAAVVPINSNGAGPRKYRHTLSGLARRGYWPTTEDQQQLVADWMADRVRVQMALDAGRITLAEARVQWPNWRLLLQLLGLV